MQGCRTSCASTGLRCEACGDGQGLGVRAEAGVVGPCRASGPNLKPGARLILLLPPRTLGKWIALVSEASSLERVGTISFPSALGPPREWEPHKEPSPATNSTPTPRGRRLLFPGAPFLPRNPGAGMRGPR